MAENTAGAKADKRSGGSSDKSETLFDMEELRELMELVNQQGFTDFEFENEDIRVRLSKAPAVAPAAQPVQLAPSSASVSNQPATGAPVPTDVPTAAADADADLHKITSPIVGTFYRSPGPDKEPYVKEGSKVSSETVVCIVEAMKLMNEIQAEVTGEVVRIYVENGQPVEFGQALFGIRK